MTETLQIADLEFEVRRGPPRKTLGLTVDRAGDLVVHAPAQASEDELRRWVTRKLLWVHRKLAQKHELNAAPRTPEFVSGESFCYLGKNFRLRLLDKSAVPLELSRGWFLLRGEDCPDGVNQASSNCRRLGALREPSMTAYRCGVVGQPNPDTLKCS